MKRMRNSRGLAAMEPHSSNSEPMESENETKYTVPSTSKGRPFTTETVAVLEALYRKVNDGLGEEAYG